MVRVATHEARVVLIDRVSPEHPEQRASQHRLETRRTPSQTYVYSASPLVTALEDIGPIVGTQARYADAMAVGSWLRAEGTDEPRARAMLTRLTAGEDPAALQVGRQGDRLLRTQQTVVLVARRPSRD